MCKYVNVEWIDRGQGGGLLAALQTVNQEIAQKVEQAKTVVVQQATGLGKVRILVPESALQSLNGIRIVRRINDKVVKEGELPSADSTHLLISGDYLRTLLFANSNYQPPTELPAGDFTVVKGGMAEILLGDLVFSIAEELKKAPVEAAIMSEGGMGREVLRILPPDNDYSLFRPKALLPGIYDVLLHYSRCEKPSKVATGLAVAAGKETVLTLDSGIMVSRPNETRGRGRDLLPADGAAPWVMVRRGWDNVKPLWRGFMVPPGTYGLKGWVDGIEAALPAGEGITLEAGKTMKFETGL